MSDLIDTTEMYLKTIFELELLSDWDTLAPRFRKQLDEWNATASCMSWGTGGWN